MNPPVLRVGFDYNLILMWQHLHIYGVVLNRRCQFVQGNEALGQTNCTEELVFLMRALVLLLIFSYLFPKACAWHVGGP
jgi:hypothetical protein